MRKNVTLRLREIFCVSEIIDEFKPCHAVIESFFNKNPKSTFSWSSSRCCYCGNITKNIPIFEISSTEIKKAIVGNGHAQKSQVQFMVKTLLKLEKLQNQIHQMHSLCFGF